MQFYLWLGVVAIGVIAGGLVNLGVPMVVGGAFVLITTCALYHVLGKSS